MARKMMFKEVTTTVVKFGKIDVVNGEPQVVEFPVKHLLGNVSYEKAQKLLNKEHGNVTIFEITPKKEVYQMPVLKFIEVAEKKEVAE